METSKKRTFHDSAFQLDLVYLVEIELFFLIEFNSLRSLI